MRNLSIKFLPNSPSSKVATSSISAFTLIMFLRASISGLATSLNHFPTSNSNRFILISFSIILSAFKFFISCLKSSWPIVKGSKDFSFPVNKKPRCPVSIFTRANKTLETRSGSPKIFRVLTFELISSKTIRILSNISLPKVLPCSRLNADMTLLDLFTSFLNFISGVTALAFHS